ncbi:transporter substrate-binding domain-containing protein [Pseudoalteromonas sp. YIC-656]|uniref:transporter substrate-binding domain-containing protein n=1 Tax=Pseudoalteromonas pernae TaxID=3118054 RepID=UPI0032428FC0
MQQSVSRVVLCFIAFILMLTSSTQAQGHERTTVSFNKPMDTAQARYVIELMSRVYDQLGYTLDIVDYSHAQALAAADQGVFDGQLARIANIESQYENLLRVNYPLFNFELFMLTRCQDCDLNALSSIAMRNGYPVTEQYLDEHNYQGQRIKIENVSAQLNLLAQQQVDGVVLLDFHLQSEMNAGIDERFQRHHLANYHSYHYVHKRHQQRIPKILAALKELEEQGVVSELKEKYGL